MTDREVVAGLRLEVDDRVATLWLDRPEKRNAVTYDMWRAIPGVCDELAADPSVRLLLVRGVGDHFCAGADVGDMAGVPAGEYRAANVAADAALASFPKPSIAVVRGACVGGGTEVAVSCDLRLADTTGRFGITPARLGIVYPVEATTRVVDLIGPSATKHLLFTAEIVDADRALRIGLVDEVAEDWLGAALTLAERIAANSPLAVQLIKQSMAVGSEASLASGLRAEAGALGLLATAEDRHEGLAAFLEKRAPQWQGR